MKSGTVLGKSSVFTIVQSGRRTTVAFRDWPSAREEFLSYDLPEFLASMRDELGEATAENECAVVAFDMTPADFVPSSFLAVLVGLHRSGMTVELLHVSAGVRQTLESTKLIQLFVVRE
jgi:hypothetical protein